MYINTGEEDREGRRLTNEEILCNGCLDFPTIQLGSGNQWRTEASKRETRGSGTRGISVTVTRFERDEQR